MAIVPWERPPSPYSIRPVARLRARVYRAKYYRAAVLGRMLSCTALVRFWGGRPQALFSTALA